MEKACLNKETQRRLKAEDKEFLASFETRWVHTRLSAVENLLVPGVIQHNNVVEELKHNEIPPQHERSQPQEETLA